MPRIVAIVGPTAVGKSALAMSLAQRFNGEIISADSRQVYRLLDIGTAKPSQADQALIAHHIVDVMYPDEQYTAATFREAARAAFESIASRNRVAFVTGGTGHYIRLLLEEGTVPRVPPDPKRRRRIETRIASHGIDSLLREIRAIDPVTANRVDPSNPRRVVRAMEIIEVTGKPIPPLSTRRLPALMMGLNTDRSTLYRIADARVDRQMACGLLEETETVASLGYPLDLPALRGLAYREMGLYISGNLSLTAAVEAYKSATHHLIRRQLTWFRAEQDVHWIDPLGPNAQEEVAGLVARFVEQTNRSGHEN
jgi:tRNA dimethylallyltransferase